MAKIRTPIHGPAICAFDPWAPSTGRMRRTRLAVMSSIARFKKGDTIYLEGDPAEMVFNINIGVVEAYKVASDGREHITAFLFADDLFGLSSEGKYTSSAKAITDVTAYRPPVTLLRSHLSKDAEFDFHVICKLCEELRQAQRHAFLLSERRAITTHRTTPHCQRSASRRNLSADGSLGHRTVHRNDA